MEDAAEAENEEQVAGNGAQHAAMDEEEENAAEAENAGQRGEVCNGQRLPPSGRSESGRRGKTAEQEETKESVAEYGRELVPGRATAQPRRRRMQPGPQTDGGSTAEGGTAAAVGASRGGAPDRVHVRVRSGFSNPLAGEVELGLGLALAKLRPYPRLRAFVLSFFLSFLVLHSYQVLPSQWHSPIISPISVDSCAQRQEATRAAPQAPW